MIQTNYAKRIILQKLARERFNNASGGEQMKASSGFSGFGGRPDIEDDEYDSDRDRSRGELFHFPCDLDLFNCEADPLISKLI